MTSIERGETFLEYTTTLSSPCLGISILQNRRIYVNNFEIIFTGKTVGFCHNSTALHNFHLPLFSQIKKYYSFVMVKLI